MARVSFASSRTCLAGLESGRNLFIALHAPYELTEAERSGFRCGVAF